MSSAHKESPYKAHIDSVESMDQGKWIQTRKINYTDPSGQSRVWEMAVRTTRTDTTGLDAVAIMGLIKRGNSPKELVLVKQFRPPCESVVIEMPAGLIDPKESVELTAERELLEETGYHGKVVFSSHTHSPLFSDPGLTNANMAVVTAEIDMADERNKNPVPQLEEGEYIEVFTLPLNGLLQGLVEHCKREKCTIDSKVYHFALGLDVAQRLGQ